jgi:hypothetical protein
MEKLIGTGGIRFELEDSRQPPDLSTNALSTPQTSYIYLRVSFLLCLSLYPVSTVYIC